MTVDLPLWADLKLTPARRQSAGTTIETRPDGLLVMVKGHGVVISGLSRLDRAVLAKTLTDQLLAEEGLEPTPVDS